MGDRIDGFRDLVSMTIERASLREKEKDHGEV